MLDISWIFANKGDFRELIVALKESPYASIFSTDLVISIVSIFEEKYKWAIWLYCFIPYLVYFFTTIVFFTLYTSAGIHNEEDKIISYFMGLIIIVLDCYFLFFEVVVIMRDGLWKFLKADIFNYF